MNDNLYQVEGWGYLSWQTFVLIASQSIWPYEPVGRIS